jgi:hypothetical protein
MKFPAILAGAVVITCLSTTMAFAETNTQGSSDISSNQQKSDKADKGEKHCKRKDHQEFIKDPIKALESRKEKVQKSLKDGKITKEKADEINSRIDAKIKAIKEFNSLPLDKKRDKLITNFKAFMDKRVKDGKLSQEEANTKIKEFTDKIKKWDGTGYPMLHDKGMKDKK